MGVKCQRWVDFRKTTTVAKLLIESHRIDSSDLAKIPLTNTKMSFNSVGQQDFHIFLFDSFTITSKMLAFMAKYDKNEKLAK